MNNSKPAHGGHVVITRWPLPWNNGYSDYKSAVTDVVGVGLADFARKDVPNVVDGWLASVDELALAANETRIVGLTEK